MRWTSSTNPEQWEAYEHDGHCAVLAPPGSGKTKLLTTKAVSLANSALGQPSGPCITLTKRCRERASEREYERSVSPSVAA